MVGGGCLRLLIEADQKPWCPELDGQIRVSLQTGVFRHVCAAEWTPEGIALFVDDRFVTIVGQSPAYPMPLMLGIYEFPDEQPAESGFDGSPKAFVDYVRGYRRQILR